MTRKFGATRNRFVILSEAKDLLTHAAKVDLSLVS